ncbi:hypothetical protein cypCar_00045890, partial [Cyprinus carpio]
GSRCLVLITVSLGFICVLLLVFIILQHITITPERDLVKSYKNTVEEFNQTINSLQDNHTDLTQKNLKLETRVKDLTAEKKQLQRDFDSLNKKKLELESKVTSLSRFFISTELMTWSDSRQYCRDRGADLVIINTEEKQRTRGIMKWVDNSTLKQGFWLKGEPNNYGGNEDCIQLNYNREKPGWSPLNSWNDVACSEKIKGICEK